MLSPSCSLLPDRARRDAVSVVGSRRSFPRLTGAVLCSLRASNHRHRKITCSLSLPIIIIIIMCNDDDVVAIIMHSVFSVCEREEKEEEEIRGESERREKGKQGPRG